jgi:hypothetical protein
VAEPGFCIFYSTGGAASAIVSVTDGREGALAIVVLADAGGVSEIPLSESDLRWLIAELQERLPKAD